MRIGSLPIAVGLLVMGLFTGALRAGTPDPAGVEFFENQVRPLLADACYKCHSQQAEKLKGKLYVDSKAGIDKGGESGKLIVPGKPDESLLIQAVRWANEDVQMPPKKKLPDAQIKVLEQWVAMGAPYPETAGGTKPITIDSMAEARRFWSFQPPKDHQPPAVMDEAWPRSKIDRFVLAKLESKGLKPSPEADRRTLIRRATLDLHGLPPTSEEVEAFVNDQSSSAWEKVLDRLLASPRYGERWGRHWLDVARYADTKGYVFQEERRYAYSYTYRDWVISALNADLPYDQFLIYQIAADRLVGSASADPTTGVEHLAAMGFLTLGRRFLNNQPDIIDDRLDVLTRGTMGLTVACARCHDHKYDPIPIKDYYSLYGVFASSTEPKEGPIIGGPQNPALRDAYEKELASRQAEVTKYLEKRHAEINKQIKTAEQISAYLLAADEAEGLSGRRELSGLAQKKNLRSGLIQRFKEQLARSKSQSEPVFAAWHEFAAVPEKEFAAKAADVAKGLSRKVNPLIEKAVFADKPPATLKEVADRYGQALAKYADRAEKCEDPFEEQLRQAVRGDNAALVITAAEIENIFERDDREKLRALRTKVDALSATHAGAPARAMVLNDMPNPVEPRIFIRGNANNPGQQVPRQFPEILSPSARHPFKDGSGRLELARLIASSDNPLTARVMVNRVWAWHFGHGIVRTPSDFGTRGERPTHPELLDHLAVRFVRDGWSIKKLHKLIMLSATYRQASNDRPECVAADAENTLLWKFNRQRLSLEAMRDSLLFASGELDASIGGRAVEITKPPFSKRRTVYGFVERQNLPGMFRSFDFASPDQHVPIRYGTTVPQQALFMMNSPFVIEQAKSLAKRTEAATDPATRIERLYQFAYQRRPAPDEQALGLAFVQSNSDSSGAALSAWQRYAQALLLANEFVFMD